jgi:single stranded DNA-binding protein
VINQVTLVGRLTKDPESRKTLEGKSVLNVTVAVNRQFKNQQGQIDTDFVLCTLWNRAADNTEKYCRKGSVIGVTGRNEEGSDRDPILMKRRRRYERAGNTNRSLGAIERRPHQESGPHQCRELLSIPTNHRP